MRRPPRNPRIRQKNSPEMLSEQIMLGDEVVIVLHRSSGRRVGGAGLRADRPIRLCAIAGSRPLVLGRPPPQGRLVVVDGLLRDRTHVSRG